MDKIRSAHRLFSIFKVLFADGIFSFEDRRESQDLFFRKDAKWAFKVIEIELSFMYDRLYTKASVSRTKCGMTKRGMIIRVVGLLLTLAGSLLALFSTIHATQYQLRHRCVTYTLLAGAVLTEAAILAGYIYSIWSLVDSDWLRCCSVNLVDRSRWSGYMAQSNLITFCLQKLPTESELKAFWVAFSSRRPRGESDIVVSFIDQLYAALFGTLNLLLPVRAARAEVGEALDAAVRQYLQRPSVLEQLQSKSFWKKYKNTRYVLVQENLQTFIFNEVTKKANSLEQREKENVLSQRGGKNQTTGTVDRHRPFADCRGDGVLEKEGLHDCLGWSFQGKDFDESLLLWHIATDLCFREEVNPGDVQQVREHMEIGLQISNYLLYIMVVHPVMLSSSTTMATKRCRDTCAEARRHFLKEHIQAKFNSGTVSEENAHASLLDVQTPRRASMVKGDKSKSVLWDGCILAKDLKQIPGDKGRKWQVICRVWVEMLCYAAVQCGGYQHAERLKEGGELITFVCLLMTHLGMGKHYRTEVGDAYAHAAPFTAPLFASRAASPQA